MAAPTTTDTVGIRDLKAHLSRHLRRVRAGMRLQVTERGRTIATIAPAGEAGDSAGVQWARRMVAEGRAHWSGGKPHGSTAPGRPASGPTVSGAVIEDRR